MTQIQRIFTDLAGNTFCGISTIRGKFSSRTQYEIKHDRERQKNSNRCNYGEEDYFGMNGRLAVFRQPAAVPIDVVLAHNG